MLKRVLNRLLATFTATLTLTGSLPAFAVSTSDTTARSVDTTSRQPVETQLPNGLKILLLEDHSYPAVACFTWYHVGARDEQPGLTGLSHVVEHLLFKDVGTYKNGALETTLTRLGAQYNGFTGDDFTLFYELIHPSKLDVALKAEGMRMRSATFKLADLKEETAHVLKELDQESHEPSERLAKEVRAIAFQQHPYRNPISGWRSDIEALSLQDVMAFYDRYYYPDNATLVLVGDFKQSDATNLIAKYFGSLPKAPVQKPSARIVEHQQNAERRVLIKEPNKKENALVAYHAVEFSAPDAPAMVVLEKLLNAHYNGRLRKELIEPKLCAGARAEYDLKKDPGLFNVYLTPTSGSSASQAVDHWDNVASRLKNQLVSDSELNRAKNLAEYALNNDKDGPYKMGFHLGLCDTLQTWQSAFAWNQKIRSVSAGDVQRLARRYFIADNRVVGMITSSSAQTRSDVVTAEQKTGADKTPKDKKDSGDKSAEKSDKDKKKGSEDKQDNSAKGKADKDKTAKEKQDKAKSESGKTDKSKDHGKGEKSKSDKTKADKGKSEKGHSSKNAKGKTEKDKDSKNGSKKSSKSEKKSKAKKKADSDLPTKNNKVVPVAMMFARQKVYAYKALSGQPTGMIPFLNADGNQPVQKSEEPRITPSPGVWRTALGFRRPAVDSVTQPDSSTSSSPRMSFRFRRKKIAETTTPGTTDQSTVDAQSANSGQLNSTIPGGTGSDTTSGDANAVSSNNGTANSGSLNGSLTHNSSTTNGGCGVPTLPVTERTLPNGIKVIVYESHLSPIVQINGFVKAGEVFESTGKKGISTVLANCWNNGGAKLNKAQLLGQQEDMGLPGDAMLNFRANESAITFRTRCMSRDVQRQLSTLGSMLKDSALSEEAIEKAKSDSIGHFRHAETTIPSRVENTLLRNVLSPGSSFYPSDAAELEKSVSALEAADVVEYMLQHVAPEATAIVIAGDITPELGFRLVEQSFGSWNHSSAFKNPAVAEPKPNPHRILKAYLPVHDKKLNAVALGRLLPLKLSDQKYAYLMMADCAFLNHPFNSRIHARLTQEPILAKAMVTDEPDLKTMQLGGNTLWSISLPVEPVGLQRAAAVLQTETKNFALSGLSSRELAEVKLYLLNGIPVRDISDSQHAAITCSRAVQSGDKADAISKKLDDVATATLEQTNRFILDELRPQQSTLVLAGGRETTRDVHAK